MTAASPLATTTTLSTKTRMLPELELEVMKILWRMRSATVGDVHEDMAPRRPLAYTTVMTVLDRLARKGAVTRFKQGRGYVYQPQLTEEYAREIAVHRLLTDFFRDSPHELASYLRQGHQGAASLERVGGQLDSSLL